MHSRYRILSVVGTGGVATVYRATDEQLGRDVALKVIPHGAVGSAELHRVEDEVRLIANLSHPALVTLFDVVADDAQSTSTLIMQFVDGEDLSARLATGALEPRTVARIGAAVAGALAFVHEAGVIHRDVKPANILLPSTGPQPALLADFGIARLVDSAGITATGTIIGTASYLSPEQARGLALDGSTDVYSLGLVLLEALTGRRAFPGSAVEAIAARMTSDPQIPSELGAAWTGLLSRMLDREPAGRPGAAEVEALLGELDAPTATLVLPVSDAATERLVTEAPTQVLAPSAEAPTQVLAPSPAASTRVLTHSVTPPSPTRTSRRSWMILAALIVALLTVVTVFALVNRGGGAVTPPSTPDAAQTSATATPTPTATPISYPAVEGQLGERLAELQSAVSVSRELGEKVLSITEASAAGDYETARAELDTLAEQVDAASLSADERDAISDAAEDVRRTLDDLIKQDDKPGKDNPGKDKP